MSVKCFLSILLIVIGTQYVFAAERSPVITESKDLENQLDVKERNLREPKLAETELKQLTKSLGDLTTIINTNIVSIETDTKKLAEQIDSLGEPIADEPPDVKAKRQSLQKQKLANEKNLSQYRLLLLRSNELLNEANSRLKERLAAKLLHKGSSTVELVLPVLREGDKLLSIYTEYLAKHHGLDKISLINYFFLLLITGAAVFTAFWAKSRLLLWYSSKRYVSNAGKTNFANKLSETFTLTTARFLPMLFFTTVMAFLLHGLLSDVELEPFILLLAYALPFFATSIWAIRLLLAPKPPARLVIPLPEKIARRLSYKLFILAALGFSGYIILTILHLQNGPPPFSQLGRDVFVLLGIVNLLWIVLYSRNIPQIAHNVLARIVFILALLILMTLELLGYRNLVLAVAQIGGAILLAAAIVFALHHLSNEFYDGLDSGALEWHKKIRFKLGLNRGQHVPGLTAIRLVTLLLLWGGFLLFSISMLDYSGSIIQSFQKVLVEGMKLGDLTINPTRLLLAIVAFAFLYTLTSWTKTQLDRQWLSKSRIERGAKEALVTISGYVGMAFALIVAFGIAGVTFTNLAIIAGALSVGIGFGLQNIVNNFVSGLILLFERPIKNGDWIIVGNTEGHVKKISIRSTQIQTFDHADVIVPNSELVSSQVTNWMLYDRSGRIRIPVGVAYGSDTEKVRQILQGVAMAHPSVVKDNADYPVRIFFLNFGDSSLDFELRCYIQDIDSALSVRSDLNFAIDKAFREQGVEIPFPQRDIHIKNNSAGDPVEHSRLTNNK